MGRRRNARRSHQPRAFGARRGPGPTPANAAFGDTGAGTAPDSAFTPPRRLAARTCGWCEGSITVKATGRLPKWCSPSCRQRAWEQSRAAASGRSAVQIVERRVEVPTPVAPRRQDWPRLLDDLARQLEDGRIYGRDLLSPSVALNDVLDAFTRRSRHSAHRQG